MNRILFFILLLIVSCKPKSNDRLKIAVAANFQYAIEEIVDAFEKETGIEADIIIGSSGKLTAQIMEGAPYDIFISADIKYPNQLFENLVAEQEPIIYAQGQLVLWTIKGGNTLKLNSIEAPETRHIALANPKTAPYGKAAFQVLENTNLFKSIENKIVYGESISQTNQFIVSGAASHGFTSLSTVLSSEINGLGKWISIPQNLYDPIQQGVISLNAGGASKSNKERFIDFLTGNKAKPILKKYGYIEPVINTPNTINSDIGEILNENNLRGSILIFDDSLNQYISNNYSNAHAEYLPASTFKIPNSIIALETEVVKNKNQVFKWDGITRSIKNWNQDLNFKDAFQYSCVPCFQQIARKVGHRRMKEYIQKINYPEMKFDGSTIDLFWLEGESRINSFDQITFIRKLYSKDSELKENTYNTMFELLNIYSNEEYNLDGKTGWAVQDDKDIGWFVGMLSKGTRAFYFATNVSPSENFDMKNFPAIRKKVTMDAFKALSIIK